MLFLLVAAIAVPVAFADDPPNPFDPPEAHIRPPIGSTSQAQIQPIGDPTTDARIRPPGGSPQGNARIHPPGGAPEPEPGFFELLIDWLVAQAHIHPPIG
jgi:hypothetical protein